MGNLVSCSVVMSARKAAEIMLENPTHFLVNAGSLVACRRFSALAADEDLEFGNIYAVFPMKRLSSVVTAADVAAVLMAVNSPAKRLPAGNAAKVSPGNDVGGVGVTSGVVVEGFVGEEYEHRLSLCRSKKLLLETIIEEPRAVKTGLARWAVPPRPAKKTGRVSFFTARQGGGLFGPPRQAHGFL